MDRKALYKLSYGLFVLTANENGKDNGCITNTAIQAASEPNTITFAVNKANYTHDMILNTGKYTISVLDTTADFEMYKHFGFQSGRTVDKFADFKDVKRLANGTLCITKGTNAYFSGSIIKTVDLGSHTLFVADVSEMEVLANTTSVTYEFYQQVIKPRPAEKPEKVEKEDGKTVWVCQICGYEYEGEELPEDFVCPLCKHPASDFEKVVK